MAFNLNIKNIGKLADADISIGRFTVLAGPNNTGKSFVSKVLYSIFDAMNANAAGVHIKDLTEPVKMIIDHFSRSPGTLDELFSSLDKSIKSMQNSIESSPPDSLDKNIADLVGKVNDIFSEFDKILPELESTLIEEEKNQLVAYQEGKISNLIKKSLSNLQEKINGADANSFIASGMKHKIKNNLLQNFQVPQLVDISGVVDVDSEVIIEGIGQFNFSKNNSEFKITSAGLKKLQQYSKVMYLESPSYWKIKGALENLRLNPRYASSRRKRIDGIPGYFYDLTSTFREEYTGDMDFPALYEILTGKEGIDGKIIISDTGELYFLQGGRRFSLSVTSMGVTNLGILALLIERKILDTDAFLFIDEPESCLHPAWQVEMASALFELAKGGAHVVLATHSTDILQWLDVHIGENPDDEKLVALNQFSADGVNLFDGDCNFKNKMAAINEELTKPFADLYMAGL